MINQYIKARKNKDKSFDGKFFVGVKTTKIFCRPSCPARLAKEENVVYLSSVYEAMNKGYRPCLRCNPEIDTPYYNKNILGEIKVEEALHLINEGYLNNNTVKDLARKLFISERNLRKLFQENLGLSPIKVATYQRTLFAKQLLQNSNLSITNIAFASGFKSVRQFNDTFKKIFSRTPSQVRKLSEKSIVSNQNVIFLPYRSNYNYGEILNYLEYRLLKGVENIYNNVYFRTFRINGEHGYFSVENNVRKHCLELRIVCENPIIYIRVIQKVKRLFDLNTNFTSIKKLFESNDVLSNIVQKFEIPRLPVVINPFEVMLRAIINQQIAIKAANTVLSRIVKSVNIKTPDYYPDELIYYFPNENEIREENLQDVGLTKTKIKTILNSLNGLASKEFSLKINQNYNEFIKSFTSIKGIGMWTANYVAMRGLGMVDAFPTNDLWIIKAFKSYVKVDNINEIENYSNGFRPYRAYAALCLWKSINSEEK